MPTADVGASKFDGCKGKKEAEGEEKSSEMFNSIIHLIPPESNIYGQAEQPRADLPPCSIERTPDNEVYL